MTLPENEVKTHDQMKADAIMEFVNMMIGAYDSGFTDRANCTLEEVYQVARNYIKDVHHVEAPHIVEAWGLELANELKKSS